MSLTSKVHLTVNANQTNSIDLGESKSSRVLDMTVSLANGTGAAGLADLLFADTRTLGASGTEDLDLSGSLTDAFGVAQVFARVVAFIVRASAANTNNVVVSRPASNGWPLFSAASDAIALRPGETFMIACGDADATGHAVTAGTGDLVTITNSGSGTSVSYDVVVIGRST